jgi:hypothetical protein
MSSSDRVVSMTADAQVSYRDLGIRGLLVAYLEKQLERKLQLARVVDLR